MLYDKKRPLSARQNKTLKLHQRFERTTTSFSLTLYSPARNMMSLRSPARSTITSFSPYFRVSSWDAVNPIMQEWLNRTALHGGWDNFGWSRRGDQLMWRSQFDDVSAQCKVFAESLTSCFLTTTTQFANLFPRDFIFPSFERSTRC